MCLDLRAVAHWFGAALLGGAVMGGRFVGGSISRIWWVFLVKLGILELGDVGGLVLGLFVLGVTDWVG